MQKLKLFIPLIFIATFGFIIYADVIKGKFIWDDNLLLKDNPRLKISRA